MSQILTAAIAIVVIYILVRILPRTVQFILNRWKLITIVDRIPGPPAIPIFGNTHKFSLDRVVFSYQLEEYLQKYGGEGIFRLWIGSYPLILLTKGRQAEPLLKSTSLITKSFNYDILFPWLGTGLLTREQASILMDRLRPMAEKGEAFDIFPYIGRCALDIICETAMGVRINAQGQSDSAYVSAVQSMSEIIFKRERMPWLQIKPIFYLLGYGFTYDKNLALLTSFTKKVIADRGEELRAEAARKGVGVAELTPGKRVAFLDLLLLMQGDDQLSPSDIAEEVDTFMFEGHDTTSSGMSWTCFLLGHHPEIQEKLFEELDAIFGGEDRPVTAEDLKEMKYLERVLKESLRLYPPVPLFARNVTEDFQSGGYTVPKGSTAMVLAFGVHRDPEFYGEDFEKFDPDRFLPENFNDRHAYAYVPFSAGPRNCIGQKFAMMEEKVVISSIIRNYKIQSLESREEVRPLPDLILRPPEHLLVKLTPRK